MKKPLIIHLLLYFVVLYGCGNAGKTPQSKQVAKEEEAELAEQEDTTIINPDTVFSLQKAQAFGDALAAYFSKVYHSPQQYHAEIDTARGDTYMCYNFNYYKDPKYPKQYYTEFRIFEFPDDLQATDFFNELKTQDLVLPFGLNKRPNHLLVNHNIVLWHYFEHPYGHRMEEIKNIFRKVFDFHPHASNLDSLSGFNYCKCMQNREDLNGVMGDWESVSCIEFEFPDSIMTRDNWSLGFDNREKELKLSIGKGKMEVNGEKLKIEHSNALDLPSAYYFIKYHFLYEENSWITPPAHELFSDLMQKEVKVSWYNLYALGGSVPYRSIDIFVFSNGIIYAEYRDHLFRLKRVKNKA